MRKVYACLVALLVTTQSEAASMLRIACDGEALGAEVALNGQFKGECPLDLQVEAGLLTVRVVKTIDANKERVFEQSLRMGDGVIKKLEIVLGSAQFTEAGRLREAERIRMENAKAERVTEENRRAEEARRKAEIEARHKAEEAHRRQQQLLEKNLADLRASGYQPGDGKRFRDCPECPEMVLIPSGSFSMGSNVTSSTMPVHAVSITEFALSAFELTFEEWQLCVTEGGCKHNPADNGWGRGRYPVMNVNWDDAQDYVRWLSVKTGLPYRLPSESEWEYACLANAENTVCEHVDAVVIDRHKTKSSGRTHLVGERVSNGWGLHEMNDNVYEWVADHWSLNYVGAPVDGSARRSGICVADGGARNNNKDNSWCDNIRVRRGTTYEHTGLYVHGGKHRFFTNKNLRHPTLGFRVSRGIK